MLATRWRRLWGALGVPAAPEPAWERLRQAYAEPQRAYHTLDHVQDCLAQLDGAGGGVEPEVEAALWLHDVVYDPRAADNEAASAAWAAAVLGPGGAPPETVERIGLLILATRHAAPPAGPQAALVVDLDLSILGRAPAEFDRYERAIRREYAWTPEPAFCAGRAALLEGLLRRTRLFATDFFFQRYEARARENLARSIGQLQRGEAPG